MNGEEGREAVGHGPDGYETAVLTFLDQELASLNSPAKTGLDDELDAVVSDMLRRVMLESEGQKAAATTEPAGALDEFPLVEIPERAVVTPFPEPRSAVAKVKTRSTASGESRKARTRSPAPEGKSAVPARIPTFEAVTAPPERKSAVIAIAVACFLILVGIVAGCHNF